MANFYKLRNQIKHYEWGSPEFIPQLMGVAGDGSPWAELWMGSHSGTSSLVSLPSGEISLGELIATDPRRYLGEKTAERYGVLPFLFKLIAAEKPLSIQAHPNLAQAREGYERENRAQLAHNAPNRNYRDSNHKPEIICALTPFTGMCGFRSPVEIQRLFSDFYAGHGTGQAPALLRDGLRPLLQALEIPAPALAMQTFFGMLFGLSQEVRQALTEFILPVQGKGSEWEIMRELARQYPGDPAIIAPLYLSVFHLEPGEAVFIKAGAPHAYIHGFGVELMANSDNVLRGGLTSKHIDIPELMNILDFNPIKPHIIKPEPGLSCFTYPAPCEEFSLTVMCGGAACGDTAGAAVWPENLIRNAPALCIVTGGEVIMEAPGDAYVASRPGSMVLKQGESAFIPAAGSGEGPLVLRGDYTLYAASVPWEHVPV
jgi:mannose-6-phosphate isomerase